MTPNMATTATTASPPPPAETNHPPPSHRHHRDDDPLLLLHRLDRVALDAVVEAVRRALSDPALRRLSQRAVQAKVWHQQPVVAAVLQDLRGAEEAVRSRILAAASRLVYEFHEHAVDATLTRAGIAPAPAEAANEDGFGSLCLDAKERLYMILKEYDWLQDFFRRYPLHFYENSFQFVHTIAAKALPVSIRVIGLGVGGSMAVSGLAKRGMAVTGYEKRSEHGPGGVTSRYQNASWRAYDTAAALVDAAAYAMLVENRQRVHVPQPDGSTAVVASDRVQIVLGAAIQAALDSARGYGAALHFECRFEDYAAAAAPCDIVALFCGAHTLSTFPDAFAADEVLSWPELDSTCRMWLRVQQSAKTEAFCARGGETGAERWHYTIESARRDVRDLERVRWNQDSQHQYQLRKLRAAAGDGDHAAGVSEEQLTRQYESQRAKLDAVLQAVRAQQQKEAEAGADVPAAGGRFDYIFTNAPANAHTAAKRDADAAAVVLDGAYTVEIKMATRSTVTAGPILDRLKARLLVLGGDASVPPNPLAAYGATLACEAAASLVHLATGIGHLNAIAQALQTTSPSGGPAGGPWLAQVDELKALLAVHYEARARAETYFQFVQTLICNLYSLPAFYTAAPDEK